MAYCMSKKVPQATLILNNIEVKALKQILSITIKNQKTNPTAKQIAQDIYEALTDEINDEE